MSLILPMTLPEGSVLKVETPGIPSRPGKVRWVKPGGAEGTLHGLEFESATRRPRVAYRRSQAGGSRGIGRRVLVGLVSLALLALAAYGLVWLVGELLGHRPQYHRPKEGERGQSQKARAVETRLPPANR